MNISLIQFSAQRDGSAFSGLLIAEALLKAGHVVKVVFATDGPMIDAYRDAGCAVAIVPHKNWLRDGRLIGHLRNWCMECRQGRCMAEALEASSPDLIYVNTAASFAGAIAAKRLDRPCVWHLRELFSNEGGELFAPAGFRWWVRRRMKRLGGRFIANSQAVAENVMGGYANEVTIIPNALDNGYFESSKSEERSEYGLSLSDTVIGLPGTLREMKGHRFAFDASRELLEHHPDLRILVSGEAKDDFGEQLHGQYSQGFWKDRVIWAGEVGDMRTFYRACDLALIPSSSEPFGRTVIESMAYGLAIVATRVGGIPEILDDGENGLLVDYGDENALRSSVKALLENPTLRKCLGDAACKKAQAEYSEVVHARRILEVVNGVKKQ